MVCAYVPSPPRLQCKPLSPCRSFAELQQQAARGKGFAKLTDVRRETALCFVHRQLLSCFRLKFTEKVDPEFINHQLQMEFRVQVRLFSSSCPSACKHHRHAALFPALPSPSCCRCCMTWQRSSSISTLTTLAPSRRTRSQHGQAACIHPSP